MQQLKCKSCGAKIETVDDDDIIGTCPYCGTQYQLHNNVNVNINFGETLKDLFTFRFKLVSNIVKYVFLFVFLSFIITFGFTAIGMFSTSKSIFSTYSKNNPIDTKKNFDRDSFNSKFEYYKGTEYKYSVERLLDKVIENNQSSTNLITISYNNIQSTMTSMIEKIKSSLDSKKYTIILDYDSNGYVDRITIKDSE